MAPLADMGALSIDRVIRRIDDGIRAETDGAEADIFWTSTFLLLGLRYPLDVVKSLMKEIRGMRESVTYQAILDEGREEGEMQGAVNEARELLVRIGTRRFGSPGSRVIDLIRGITERETLEQLVERVLVVMSWQELLANFVDVST